MRVGDKGSIPHNTTGLTAPLSSTPHLTFPLHSLPHSLTLTLHACPFPLPTLCLFHPPSLPCLPFPQCIPFFSPFLSLPYLPFPHPTSTSIPYFFHLLLPPRLPSPCLHCLLPLPLSSPPFLFLPPSLLLFERGVRTCSHFDTERTATELHNLVCLADEITKASEQ